MFYFFNHCPVPVDRIDEAMHGAVGLDRLLPTHDQLGFGAVSVRCVLDQRERLHVWLDGL